MRDRQFDRLTRLLARGLSRRELLRWLRNGAIGALVAPSLGSVARGAQVVPNEDIAQHILKLIPEYKQYGAPAYDVTKRTLGYLLASIACVQRGYDAETCQNAALLCAVNDGALKLHPYAGLIGIPDLFGAFKRDCGSGQCFQCCWNGSLCHSSFIGFPRINCNKNYGPETAAAGITLIVDPDAQPGDACLFIQQTCDHIPLCVGGRRRYIPPSELAGAAGPASALALAEEPGETYALAATPGPAQNEWIASQAAIDNRARTFATQLETEVQKYLAAYTTELPADAGAEENTLHELALFLFGRGRPGWTSAIMGAEGWQDDVFVVRDAGGQPVEPASRTKTAQLLGLTRLLAAVPNVASRLAAVESRVWSDPEIDAYIAAVGDVDQELLRWMSPRALELLQRVMALQYYGLLAVPLAGEPASPRTFDGVLLGRPPVVRAAYRAVDERGVELTLTIADPEAPGATGWPVNVDWGDGQVTHHELPAGAGSHTLSHTYDAGGGYLVVASAANETGLRGFAAVVVATASTQARAASPRIPVFSRAVLDVETTFSGSPALQVDAMLLDEGGDPVLAGRSGQITSSETSRSVFAAHNPLQLGVRTLRLVTWYGGLPIIGTPVVRIAPLAFDVFSTATAAYVRHTVAAPAAQVRAFYGTPGGPTSVADVVTQADDGTLSVPMRATPPGGARSPLAHIEIDLTPELFEGLELLILDLTGSAWKAGQSAAWVEERPGSFVAAADAGRVYLPMVNR